MKAIIFIFTLAIAIILLSCDSKIKKEKRADIECIKLTLPEKIDNLIQLDSVFLKRKVIPLESSDNCLIGEITKILFYRERMFILDKSIKLLAFDMNGKYLFNVGQEGRGPGEYASIRDFDIDETGNIYMLAYQKILQYDKDGKYLKTFRLNLVSENSEIFCNPLEFAVKKDGNFYIWGGSFGIKDNSEGKFFAMYEITKDGKVINKYFPLKYNSTQGFERHRFTRYSHLLLIEPNYGVDTIYSIDNQGLKPRYYIDFGNKKMKIRVPEGFGSLREFKLKVDQLFYHNVHACIETDEWLYFRFDHKMKRYNVYYAKKLGKAFVSNYKTDSGLDGPVLITAMLENDLVGYCNPQHIVKSINEVKTKGNLNLSANGKEIIKNLNNLKPTDNPVLFVCSMKKY
jgi:hypothetical protein